MLSASIGAAQAALGRSRSLRSLPRQAVAPLMSVRAAGGEAGGVRRRRVGIVGYGTLGRHLAERVQGDDAAAAALELAFVWNRNPEPVAADVASGALPPGVLLADLDAFASRGAELIVEVAHPSITARHGAAFLRAADYLVGSPTCFAEAAVESAVRCQLAENLASGRRGSLYIPSGALWGIHDIQKMAERGTLESLKVTMTFAPAALRVAGDVAARLEAAGGEEALLYEGPVRALCPMAPNNVNSIAAAALAGHTMGFDGTIAKLVAASPEHHAHVVRVQVVGPGGFSVDTTRVNPARPGAVTGNATYASFVSSVIAAARSGALGPEAGMYFV